MSPRAPQGDPRAVIEGSPAGRRRTGLAVGIVAAVGCSLVLLGVDLVQSVDSSARSAAPFLIALPLALLPVPFLIALVLLLDRLEPEPRENLVFAFAWGAGIAALLAAVINTAGLIFITQPDLGKTTGQYVSATFGAPVVEEVLKGSVLMWLLWRRRQELDGPTDGVIYAAMVGLGFAMMENIGSYMGALVRSEVGGTALLGVTFVFRGILAPFAHPAFTALTGIGVAYAATHRRSGWAVAAGLIAAIVLHGLWNGLTRFGVGGIVLAYGMLASVVIVLLAVVIADRRQIVRLIWQFLPGYAETGLVTEADLRMLTSLRERRQARRWAREAGGRRGARAMTDYQLAATELALVHLRAQRRAIEATRFADRRQALVGLMAAARAAFLRDLGEPARPRHRRASERPLG
ncbi:MAG TPA: PrsW family intramembrane metalloprotease [Streptosporangiaceae bacterium]